MTRQMVESLKKRQSGQASLQKRLYRSFRFPFSESLFILLGVPNLEPLGLCLLGKTRSTEESAPNTRIRAQA